MDKKTGIPQSMIDGLDNWARAYRPHRVAKTCGSAEGNYRPPWRQWLTYADIPITTPIDHHLAERYEKAWASLTVRRYRQILQLLHMTALPDPVVARKAGTKVWKLKHDYDRAVEALAKMLGICYNDLEQAKI